jgi:hypothetical protein
MKGRARKQEELNRKKKERKAEEERETGRAETGRGNAARLRARDNKQVQSRMKHEMPKACAGRSTAMRMKRMDEFYPERIGWVREQLKEYWWKYRRRSCGSKTAAINALHTLFSRLLPSGRNKPCPTRSSSPTEVGAMQGGEGATDCYWLCPGCIDEVPLLHFRVNLKRRDMDAWSLWFDLLAALNIIEEQLMSRKSLVTLENLQS